MNTIQVTNQSLARDESDLAMYKLKLRDIGISDYQREHYQNMVDSLQKQVSEKLTLKFINRQYQREVRKGIYRSFWA